MESEFKEFLGSPFRSKWITVEPVSVYIRKSIPRRFNGAFRTCLDIGNIEVAEDFQRQGMAKRTIQALERLNPFESIFIENVLNPILEEALIRWGWSPDETHPKCFYRLNT